MINHNLKRQISRRTFIRNSTLVGLGATFFRPGIAFADTGFMGNNTEGLSFLDACGVVKDWGADPYSLGGWSWPGPGYITNHLADLKKPFGRIHFAGEYTSILRATMEGALQSGVRAAREVDEQVEKG